MNVFLLRRRLRVGDQEVVVPVGLYRRKEEALEAGAKLHEQQAAMLECLIVRPTETGEGEDTGIRVGQYLAAVGVVGFKPEIVEVELIGSMIEIAGTMPSGAPVWRS